MGLSLDTLPRVVHGLDSDALGLHVGYRSFGVASIAQNFVAVLTQYRRRTSQQGRSSRKPGRHSQVVYHAQRRQVAVDYEAGFPHIGIMPEFGDAQVFDRADACSLKGCKPL